MNLAKITERLFSFVAECKLIHTPNVLELYEQFGSSIMGRDMRSFQDAKGSEKEYFNKSEKHKEHNPYIGLCSEGFIAQDIVTITSEERNICVNGAANNWQGMADLIKERFGIKSFVFDSYTKAGEGTRFLMEVNEIHLSTLSKEEFDWVLSQLI